MVLGKFKRNPFLVLTLLLGVIFQSCNSDYDEYVDEAEHSKKENTTDYALAVGDSQFHNGLDWFAYLYRCLSQKKPDGLTRRPFHADFG